MPVFSTDTLEFLAELRENNNRDWFQANKERYETLVREPALDFIETMQPLLSDISEHFTAIPKKTGGSLMRVYRDTRFSRDKTPYKTNIGIQFRHNAGKDIHAPGYYVHISNEQNFLGVGLWHPESKVLSKIRDFIVEQPDHWKNARNTNNFRQFFELQGDVLQRPPRGYAKDHPWVEDLKRKDFIGMHELDDLTVTETGFSARVAHIFNNASPFMRFLCRALDLPF